MVEVAPGMEGFAFDPDDEPIVRDDLSELIIDIAGMPEIWMLMFFEGAGSVE